MTGQIILLIVLIAMTAALTYCESSVASLSDSKIEKIIENSDKKSQNLKKLWKRREKFLTAAHSAVMLAALLSSALACHSFAKPLAELTAKKTDLFSEAFFGYLFAVLITVAVAVLVIAFGEIVPMRAAARNPESSAIKTARVSLVISAVFAPMMWITKALAKVILKLIGIDPDKELNAVTEEEILMMSDEGAEKGTIDEDDNRIIKNIFAFDDLTADQVCTHRTNVSVLWSSDDISVWEETIHRTRHSNFPICGENVDHVIGVLDAKDYFRLDDKSRENIMANAVREPYFVHENMKADRLFEHMKQVGADHFAVVVDEYGGMSGILTVTDLVEELVGDFADDDDDETIIRLEKIGENEWLIPGMTSLSDVCEELEVELPEDKYDTFGGYVVAELGEIPKDGTLVNFDADGLRISVLEVRHHRIEACRVEKLPQEKDEEETE